MRALLDVNVILDSMLQRNLLFAVLALQADCVTREQFIDACTLCSSQRNDLTLQLEMRS